ncbi:MAG: TonB-dependent receptor [Bacteroidetes bacterium]|nr:TonB-dependent receptor [Bacteroidota bacterium]
MIFRCKNFLLFSLSVMIVTATFGRNPHDSTRIFVTVKNEQQLPLEAAIVSLIRLSDNTLIKSDLTDDKGNVLLENIPFDKYYFNISFAGYITDSSKISIDKKGTNNFIFILQPTTNALQSVTVTSRKPLIQHEEGNVIVNVDASPSNAGTSVLDVLEKSPGVTVDRNGTISLRAKQGVLVLIDGKQTYLSGTDLNNLLAGMSSSQVEQIELMTNPPAQYDASGNAGIINIKTKKNKQKGFNGTITSAYTQGRYPKDNSSIVLNYRNGRFNTFITYSDNYNKSYSDLYALRTYSDDAGHTIATLDQPTLFMGKSNNHTLKTGIDFYATSHTTLGLVFNGTLAKRNGSSDATATWLNANNNIDSSIKTTSNSHYSFKNGGINFNIKHTINKKQDISADVDWLHYDITSNPYFSNKELSGSGNSDASKGNLPSTLKIFTAKADYSLQLDKTAHLEAGAKTSHINTDNTASYDYFNGIEWMPDYGKSNHFIYTENINAAYASLHYQSDKISAQLGLRYENTSYKANQLGNAMRKDSSFTRQYDGLFPTASVTWQADSSNGFTFTTGRRIDRPAFHSLNPFVFIINKYTYETGNPYFKPQYTWNFELSHQYKSLLTTTLSYSVIKDYFSQLFLTDSTGILYYSQGNVGNAYIADLSISPQLDIFKWWNLTGEFVLNYKKLKGYVWNDYASDVMQFSFSMNNLFIINDKYTAELSGFYTGRSRNDLQEALMPTGQLNAAISRSLFNKRATIKLSIRDIFHSQVMEGNTDFEHADEYFIIRRDSRVFTVAFTWRFGKPIKTIKHSSGATDEMERVNG